MFTVSVHIVETLDKPMDATEEKEPIDEDVLGHNQILLQRKKRLVSELTTLENEVCPLLFTNILKSTTKQQNNNTK